MPRVVSLCLVVAACHPPGGFIIDDTTLPDTPQTMANDPPVAADLALTTPADTAINGQLSATDPEGAPLTFMLVASPQGSVALSADGAFTYTPHASGLDSFTFVANDGTQDSNIATVTIAVGAMLTIEAQAVLTTEEDTPLTLAPSALTTTDPTYPANYTLTIADGAHYTHVGNVITPAADFNGALSVPVSVSNGIVTSPTVAVTVDVTPVNDAPAVAPSGVIAMRVNQSLVLDFSHVNASDVDGLAGLTLSVAGASGYTVPTGTEIRPSFNVTGDLFVPVTVSDPSGATGSTIVQVDVVNVQPLIRGPTGPVVTVLEDGSVLLDVAMLDVDDGGDVGQTLTLTVLDGLNYGVSGNTVFPDLDHDEPLFVEVVVNDGVVDSLSYQTFPIAVTPVNDAPVIAPTGPIAVALNESITLVAGQHVSVTDVDGDASFTLELLATAGTGWTAPSGQTVIPNQDYVGVMVVPVRVRDADLNGWSNELEVTISVANRAPVLAGVATLPTGFEDVALPLPISAVDATDLDGQPLSIVIVGPTGTPRFAVAGSGSNIVVPDADENGVIQVEVKVTDGIALSANSVVLNVYFTPVNDAPVIAPSGIRTSAIGRPVSFSENDVRVVTDDETAGVYAVAVTGGIGYTFTANSATPTTTVDADILVNVVLIDAGGLTSAPTGVLVQVRNDTPFVTAPTGATGLEDTPLLITPSMLNIDDDDLGQTYTVHILDGLNYGPSGAWVVPDANFNGTLNVSLYVNDGLADSNTLTQFTVSVAPVGDAPIAPSGLSYTFIANEQSSGSGLLAGASDPDDNDSPNDVDPPITVVAASGSTTRGGQYSIDPSGTFAYAAPPGATGADSFPFVVTDGGLRSPTGSIAVTITGPVNWYVDASATPPGDGRKHRPFTSLSLADAAAPSIGTTVYVRPGTYALTSTFSVSANQAIAATGVVGPSGVNVNSTPAAFTLGDGASLNGLNVTGGNNTISASSTPSGVTLANVNVQASVGAALSFASASVTLLNVAATGPTGLVVTGGNTLNLNGVRLRSSNGAAFTAAGVQSINAPSGFTNSITAEAGAAINWSNVSDADARFSSVVADLSPVGVRLSNVTGDLVIATTSVMNRTGGAIAASGCSFLDAQFGSTTINGVAMGSDALSFVNNTSSTFALNVTAPITAWYARGLFAATGGTINFGAPPSFSVTNGNAVDITNTSGTMQFASLTSTNSSAGARFANMSTAVSIGSLSATGSVTGLLASGSSAAFSVNAMNTSGTTTGIQLTNDTGSLALGPTGGTFSGATDGVIIDNARNITLNKLAIVSPTNNGIRVDSGGAEALSFVGGRITGAGNSQFERAFNFGTGARLRGNNFITSATISTSVDDAIYWESTGGVAALTISNTRIDIDNEASGVVARLDPDSTGATMALTLDNVDIIGGGASLGAGLNVATEGTVIASNTITVRDSTFTQSTRSGDAILVTAAGPGTTTIAIGPTGVTGNTFDGWTRVIRAAVTHPNAHLQGTIANNTIGASQVPLYDAITVLLDAAPTAVTGDTISGSVTIENNSIDYGGGSGIVALARSGKNAMLQYLRTIITNNNVESAVASANPAIALRATETTRLCADLASNSADAQGTNIDILARGPIGATNTNVVGTLGTALDALNTRNPSSVNNSTNSGVSRVLICD